MGKSIWSHFLNCKYSSAQWSLSHIRMQDIQIYGRLSCPKTQTQLRHNLIFELGGAREEGKGDSGHRWRNEDLKDKVEFGRPESNGQRRKEGNLHETNQQPSLSPCSQNKCWNSSSFCSPYSQVAQHPLSLHSHESASSLNPISPLLKCSHNSYDRSPNSTMQISYKSPTTLAFLPHPIFYGGYRSLAEALYWSVLLYTQDSRKFTLAFNVYECV